MENMQTSRISRRIYGHRSTKPESSDRSNYLKVPAARGVQGTELTQYFTWRPGAPVENRFSAAGLAEFRMMQETSSVGLTGQAPWDVLPGQSLVTLLALVGTKKMEVEALRAKAKLTPAAFGSLLGWLQREYLVDVVPNLEGDAVEQKVALTEKGEVLLVGMLERTCELPELR